MLGRAEINDSGFPLANRNDSFESLARNRPDDQNHRGEDREERASA